MQPVPFRELPEDRQGALREAWAAEMARQGTTCSPEEKVSRLAAWRAPRGFVLAAEDLPRRRRDPAG